MLSPKRVFQPLAVSLPTTPAAIFADGLSAPKTSSFSSHTHIVHKMGPSVKHKMRLSLGPVENTYLRYALAVTPLPPWGDRARVRLPPVAIVSILPHINLDTLQLSIMISTTCWQGNCLACMFVANCVREFRWNPHHPCRPIGTRNIAKT